MAKINETLRQLRLDRDMTQEQVAEQVGLTRQAVSSYESGRTQPGVDILQRLADIYEVELTDIIYGRGKGLRLYRGLKITAIVMAGMVLAAELLASLLLWTANNFFAIEPGQMDQAKLLIWATRSKLLNGYAYLGDAYHALILLFCVALLTITLCLSRPLSAKMKIPWVLGFAVASVLVVLPWALTDPVYTRADYFLMPVLSLFRTVPFLLASLVIDFFRGRKRKRAEKAAQEKTTE